MRDICVFGVVRESRVSVREGGAYASADGGWGPPPGVHGGPPRILLRHLILHVDLPHHAFPPHPRPHRFHAFHHYRHQ